MFTRAPQFTTAFRNTSRRFALAQLVIYLRREFTEYLVRGLISWDISNSLVNIVAPRDGNATRTKNTVRTGGEEKEKRAHRLCRAIVVHLSACIMCRRVDFPIVKRVPNISFASTNYSGRMERYRTCFSRLPQRTSRGGRGK